MDLTRDDVALIRILGVSRNGLHIYTIFKRSGLAAPAMSRALGSLQRREILTMDGEVAALTHKGRQLIASRPTLLLGASTPLKERLDRAPTTSRTSDFKGPTIGVNELYVPRTSELPRSLLKMIAAEPTEE